MIHDFALGSTSVFAANAANTAVVCATGSGRPAPERSRQVPINERGRPDPNAAPAALSHEAAPYFPVDTAGAATGVTLPAAAPATALQAPAAWPAQPLRPSPMAPMTPAAPPGMNRATRPVLRPAHSVAFAPLCTALDTIATGSYSGTIGQRLDRTLELINQANASVGRSLLARLIRASLHPDGLVGRSRTRAAIFGVTAAACLGATALASLDRLTPLSPALSLSVLPLGVACYGGLYYLDHASMALGTGLLDSPDLLSCFVLRQCLNVDAALAVQAHLALRDCGIHMAAHLLADGEASMRPFAALEATSQAVQRAVPGISANALRTLLVELPSRGLTRPRQRRAGLGTGRGNGGR